jgi:biopolymer transport protein ExbD
LFERWKRTVEETRELELIPVMNLFMVLIPFLLMGAAFYHVGVVPSSLPTHVPDDSDVPRTPTKITANLAVTPDRIELGASSTSLTDEQLAELGGSWPNRDGEYDIEGVQERLVSIKKRYPHSDTMIVLPHEELEYQALVEILDGTRELKRRGEKGERLASPLFPVVVFSRFIPPPPSVDGGEPLAETEAEGAAQPEEQEP